MAGHLAVGRCHGRDAGAVGDVQLLVLLGRQSTRHGHVVVHAVAVVGRRVGRDALAVLEGLHVGALVEPRHHPRGVHHAMRWSCWPHSSSPGRRGRLAAVTIVRVVHDGARLVGAALMFDHGSLTTEAVRIVRLVVSAASDTVNVRFGAASMLARVRSFSSVDSAVARQTRRLYKSRLAICEKSRCRRRLKKLTSENRLPHPVC